MCITGLVVENVRLGRKRSLLIAICNGGMVVGNAIGLGATGPLVEATQLVTQAPRREPVSNGRLLLSF